MDQSTPSPELSLVKTRKTTRTLQPHGIGSIFTRLHPRHHEEALQAGLRRAVQGSFG